MQTGHGHGTYLIADALVAFGFARIQFDEPLAFVQLASASLVTLFCARQRSIG